LNGHLTFSIVLSEPICDDPDDDKFFAAAIASKSKLIVSGDKHLLKRTGYSGITVVKPAVFLKEYLKKN
jgi:predicted nucleic acid-binding protein